MRRSTTSEAFAHPEHAPTWVLQRMLDGLTRLRAQGFDLIQD